MDQPQVNKKGMSAPARPQPLAPAARALRRATEGPAARHGRDRWSRWAASLASKHRAIGRAKALAPMIFAASGVVERILRERWVRSTALYPTIRLSFGQTRRLSGPPWKEMEPPPGSSERRAGREAEERGGASPASLAEAGRELRSVARRDNPPLDRVFRRLNGAEELSSAGRRIALAREVVYATARRITENIQRVEERAGRPVARPCPFVFKQAAPPAGVAREWADEPGPGWQRERPLPRGFPAIDVNELTEQVIRQIDQRATAWRERMGKI